MVRASEMRLVEYRVWSHVEHKAWLLQWEIDIKRIADAVALIDILRASGRASLQDGHGLGIVD